MTKPVLVRFHVESINASRQQFKPYSHVLRPENLLVEMELEPEQVVSSGKDGVVITLQGFGQMVGEIASTFDNMHQQWVIAERKKGNAVV